jgi:hypothetical protein
MMNHARFLLAATLATVVSAPAYTRDIGVATAITGNPPIRIQMDVSPTTRLDATFRREATQYDIGSSHRSHALGLGGLLTREPADAMRLYYGARAMWLNQRISHPGNAERACSDWRYPDHPSPGL